MKTTYRGLPHFYPRKGDLLSPSQIDAMVADGQWVTDQYQGNLVLDMEDGDGRRADWFEYGKDRRCGRVLCVPTFASGRHFWLVVNTSY